MNPNTPTFRNKAGIRMKVCPQCNGGGGFVHSHYTGNPELERLMACGTCYGDGSVRCDQVDPLERLAGERRVMTRHFNSHPANFTRMCYERAKNEAMRPVVLP